jgi:hypothetical protein
MPDERFRLTEEEARRVEQGHREAMSNGWIMPAPEPEPEPIRLPLRRPENPGEYTDANRFPLTTEAGMTPAQQMENDNAWIEELREYLSEDGTLTARKRAELVELLCKVPVQAKMLGMAKQRSANRQAPKRAGIRGNSAECPDKCGRHSRKPWKRVLRQRFGENEKVVRERTTQDEQGRKEESTPDRS